MRHLLASGLFIAATAAASLLVACSFDDGSTTGSDDEIQSRKLAKQGETCGNGVFGTPKIACARGLVCAYPASTAPAGPSGSSSARTGTCEKPAAAEGETCGNGVFGTPKIDCAEGLVCTYPASTAPTGPSGSSSALAGKCTRP